MIISKKEYNKRLTKAIIKERDRIWERQNNEQKFDYVHHRINDTQKRVDDLEKRVNDLEEKGKK